MEEILKIANQLGGVSFATLLLVILYGSWRGVWVWGRDAERRIAAIVADRDRREQALADDRDWWRNIGVRATGIAETQGQLLRVKDTKATRELEDLNRRLLE